MNNLNMNTQLGTKWFTFFTKVRPWLGCIAAIPIVVDFMEYPDLYMDSFWLILHLFMAIAHVALNIMVFTKSKGNYISFVRFVKVFLLFEVINITYGRGFQLYLQNGAEFDSGIVIVSLVVFCIVYLIWYNKNIEYFEKRIINNDNFQYVHSDEETNKIRFCRKCGEPLMDSSKFCRKCGTEVVELKLTNIPDTQEFNVIIFDTGSGEMRTEMRKVDVKKFPPEKFSDNNTYYAIETMKEGKKVRIYCRKDNWEKQIENNKATEV